MSPSARSDRQQHGPGRAVLEVDQICVPRPLDRQPGPVAVREQRPVRRGLERPVRVGAAGDHDRVPVARATLGRNEVVPVAAAIEVRSL